MLNRKLNSTKLIMETWRRFINEGAQIENQDLVFAAHNAWLEGYNVKNSNKPRPKDFGKKVSDLLSLETCGEKSVEDLLNQGKLYFSDVEGDKNPELLTQENIQENQEMILYCDIAQPPQDLISDCILKFNGPQGKAYLQNKQAIISAAESGDEQQLGELIHDIWKDLNKGWKEYWSPIQAGSYENLDSYNKLLDLLVAKAVCEQCNCNMSKNILDLINKYKEESK